nr:MAG TPA: hypothetical protein [Caudoviricetes sp.]DAP57720.1 MAG TPA: hypothetical protein [Caudoviricetes sp.]
MGSKKAPDLFSKVTPITSKKQYAYSARPGANTLCRTIGDFYC